MGAGVEQDEGTEWEEVLGGASELQAPSFHPRSSNQPSQGGCRDWNQNMDPWLPHHAKCLVDASQQWNWLLMGPTEASEFRGVRARIAPKTPIPKVLSLAPPVSQRGGHSIRPLLYAQSCWTLPPHGLQHARLPFQTLCDPFLFLCFVCSAFWFSAEPRAATGEV